MQANHNHSFKKAFVKILVTTIITFSFFVDGICQETIFSLVKSDLKKAHEYYNEKSYERALSLYLKLNRKNSEASQYYACVARCYYHLHQFDRSINWFEKYANKIKAIPQQDLLYYADALTVLKRYDEAVAHYKLYMQKAPNDPHILKKIWQLKNIQYLYEDSIYYSIKPISINTKDDEFFATSFKDGVVFISDRKEVAIIDKIDGSSLKPFYKLYYSAVYRDTTSAYPFKKYSKPQPFARTLSIKYHVGPIAFFEEGNAMVYTASAAGKRTLGLYFAKFENGQWQNFSSFPYNSSEYSISEPTTNDGLTLYFSSDMPGGYGGRDLYRSSKINDVWTTPENLGDQVNTPYDESFPFVHSGNTLYFSSNGHAGLGGVDIFKTHIDDKSFHEVKNLGFPINSSYDEFGLTLVDAGTQGYFSTNRNERNGDDIYELEMDLQTYPIVINGKLRYKELSWKDSSELKVLPNAKLFLIDNLRNVSVQQTTSDNEGNFSLTVQYFSQYKIKVVESDGHETVVSLDMTKNKKIDMKHEIVVVKNFYASDE